MRIICNKLKENIKEKPKTKVGVVKEQILLEHYRTLPIISKLTEEKLVGFVSVKNNYLANLRTRSLTIYRRYCEAWS